MKTIILNSLSVVISISLTAWMFYSNRALQYWGGVTTCVITNCEFIEQEYEGRNKIVSKEALGIAYSFSTGDKGPMVESKNVISAEQVYYLLEMYFAEQIENEEDFYYSFYKNPSSYLKGKKMKLRYLKSNPQNNVLNMFYEERNILGDIVLSAVIFVMIFGVLFSIAERIADNKSHTS